MTVAEEVKDFESIRTAVRRCKQDPTKIPFAEWKGIVKDFCWLVDREAIPFDPNLSSFCHYLVDNHSNGVEDTCVECSSTADCGYKEEKVTTSFNSFNVGMLYGIALARILYTEVTEDVKS